jgi:serine/threonine protein kinase
MPAPLPTEKAPRTTLSLGEVLEDATTGDRFRITGFIGLGGMGEVYLGQAEGSGAAVAIKTIPLALAADPKVVIRTQFESRALRELRHRNVVQAVGAGVRPDGVIFMVMEYLPGMTLLDLRRTQGRIPVVWSLEIVRDACHGLIAVHDHAVHRDVKPANLHFGTDAVVRILDLGLAKWKRPGMHPGMQLTTVGTQVGTVAYMAPELLDESAPVDTQADIWSAGVVLYELLTDRHPFAVDGKLPESAFLLGSRILDEHHVPLRDVAPLCPGYLAQIVDKALAKDPRARHRSAEEFSQVLTEAMERFAEENGDVPPLEELAAQTFPDAPRRVSTTRRVTKKEREKLKMLQATEPVDPKARSGQAAALPYLRTAEMAAVGAGVAGGEREAPRVSDVFVRKERVVEESLPEVRVGAPATAPVVVSGAPGVVEMRAEARGPGRAGIVGVVLVLVVAGVVAVGVGIGWWVRGVDAGAMGAAAPSATATAGASGAPSGGRAAPPAASSAGRHGAAPRPSAARPGR